MIGSKWILFFSLGFILAAQLSQNAHARAYCNPGDENVTCGDQIIVDKSRVDYLGGARCSYLYSQVCESEDCGPSATLTRHYFKGMDNCDKPPGIFE